MKIVLVLCATLVACASAFARPLVIGPSQRIDATLYEGAMAGNEAVFSRLETFPAFVRINTELYQRAANGQWSFVRPLKVPEEVPHSVSAHAQASMSATVAAVKLPSGLHIFERTAAGWVEGVLDIPRPRGYEVSVVGNRVLASSGGEPCSPDAVLLERGTNGHWNVAAPLPVPVGSCVFTLALDEDAAAVMTYPGSATAPPVDVRIFERSGSAWPLAAALPSPDPATDSFSPWMDIHDGLMVISGGARGLHVFSRDSSGWISRGVQPLPDGVDSQEQRAFAIRITDDYVLASGWSAGRRDNVGYLFRRGPNQSLTHVANLVAPPGPDGGTIYRLMIDGNHALDNVAESHPSAFDLPASFDTPPTVQDDFESGLREEWQILPGSSISTGAATNRVLLQSSLAGDAGAVYATDRTNQSISAEIELTAVSGQDRWAGLVTRYTSERDYYYVTLRVGVPGTLSLRRMSNGVFSELARVQVGGVEVGRKYRLTLQSSDTQHQVYLDDEFKLVAYDDTHPHGKAGVRTFRAGASFDNVVMTSGPLSFLSNVGPDTVGGSWTSSPPGAATPRATQNSLDGEARALFGTPVEDSVVAATFVIDQFGTNGSPWVGLMSRYVDSGNYYYVTLRKSHELSLRKLTNGVITVLATRQWAVPESGTYDVRFETIGDQVRVWVNGQLAIEHTGAQIRAGRVGMMTYRARATLTKLTAYMP